MILNKSFNQISSKISTNLKASISRIKNPEKTPTTLLQEAIDILIKLILDVLWET